MTTDCRTHPEGVFVMKDPTLAQLLGLAREHPGDVWVPLADRLEELGRPHLAQALRGPAPFGLSPHLVWQQCIADAPTPEGRARCEQVTWHEKYVEPGYTTPEAGICLGDWNAAERHTVGYGYRDVDDTPELLGALLEALGVELEWCDEWTTCDRCDGLLRTDADSFVWEPSYRHGDDGEMVCLGCWEYEHGGDEDAEEADGPGECPGCGGRTDGDCHGEPRCDVCDGPCPHCGDGN